MSEFQCSCITRFDACLEMTRADLSTDSSYLLTNLNVNQRALST